MIIFSNLFYGLSVGLLFLGFFRLKKSDRTLDGMLWVLISLVVYMAFNSVTAEFLLIFGLKSRLGLMGSLNLLVALPLLFYPSYRKRQRQDYTWSKRSLFEIFLIALSLSGVSIWFFKPSLTLSYETSDPARHFLWALDFARTSVFRLGWMNFHLVNVGMILKMIQPWLDSFNLYKVFILCDIGFFILNALLFYQILLLITEKWKNYWLAIIGTLFYACGYPLNSLIFGFGYFQTGLILILTILLVYFQTERSQIRAPIFTGMLFLLVLGLFNSYPLFVPIVVASIFLISILLKWNTERYASQPFWPVMLGAIVLPAIISIFQYFFLPNTPLAISTLSLDGYIYFDLFRDFILFLPFVFFFLWATYSSTEGVILKILFVFTVVQMIITLVLGIYGLMSPYYYAKHNALLWIQVCSMTFGSLAFLIGKMKWKQLGLLTGSAFILIILLPIINRMLEKVPATFNPQPTGTALLPVYGFNSEKIRSVDEHLHNEKRTLFLEARNLAQQSETTYLPLISFNSTDGIWFHTMTDLFPEATWNDSELMTDPQKIYDRWEASDADFLIYIDNRENFQLMLNKLIHNHHVVIENRAGYIFKK